MNKQIKSLSTVLYALLFGALIAAATGSPAIGLVFAALKFWVSKRMTVPFGALGEGNPETKTADEIKAEIKAKQEALKLSIEGKAEKSEVDALRLEIDGLKDEKRAAEVAALEAKLEEQNGTLVSQGEEITKLKDHKGGSKKSSLVGEMSEKKDDLKKLAKGESALPVELKALVLRSAITDNQNAFDLPDIGQLAHRKLAMLDIFPKLTIGKGNHNGVIRYYDWDEATIARAAAAVAEGAAFPESTAKFKKSSVTIQKIGDTLPVTEEFFEDEEMFAAELGLFLQTNVSIEVDRQLALGDGTGNTMTGLVASVNAYTPVASAISDASIYDLLVKVSEAITTTGGSKYSPDFAVMNIADINKMRLKKDDNENYILPPFASRDGGQVAGMVVIESNIITANTMVVGDRRFARIYEMAGMEIAKGHVGTQFTEDEMTLKVRKRMAFLIRYADKGGFLKVTDITAALTTLAS